MRKVFFMCALLMAVTSFADSTAIVKKFKKELPGVMFVSVEPDVIGQYIEADLKINSDGSWVLTGDGTYIGYDNLSGNSLGFEVDDGFVFVLFKQDNIVLWQGIVTDVSDDKEYLKDFESFYKFKTRFGLALFLDRYDMYVPMFSKEK